MLTNFLKNFGKNKLPLYYCSNPILQNLQCLHSKNNDGWFCLPLHVPLAISVRMINGTNIDKKSLKQTETF